MVQPLKKEHFFAASLTLLQTEEKTFFTDLTEKRKREKKNESTSICYFALMRVLQFVILHIITTVTLL